MPIQAHLRKATKAGKKYTVTVQDGKAKPKTIHFGAKGMSDYTIHKDKERMGRYTVRHGGLSSQSKTSRKENWGKSGVKTAGFWSKWLLWNKPSFNASKSDISKRFGVRFVKGIKEKNKKSTRAPRKSRK